MSRREHVHTSAIWCPEEEKSACLLMSIFLIWYFCQCTWVALFFFFLENSLTKKRSLFLTSRLSCSKLPVWKVSLLFALAEPVTATLASVLSCINVSMYLLLLFLICGFTCLILDLMVRNSGAVR